MKIETSRLIITDFRSDMARDVHLGSLDEDTRRFLPDEVFETEEIAADILADLIACYNGTEGPFVHPIMAAGEYAGYVQLVPLDDGWEIGYHVVKSMTGRGYATEAVRAFLPVMIDRLNLAHVAGICDAENKASIRVLEKCGFTRTYEGEALYHGKMKPVVKTIYTK